MKAEDVIKLNKGQIMEKEGAITMCFVGGFFVVGKLIGERMLRDPRLFQIIENGQKIQMAPLPANPPWILLKGEAFTYPVPATEKNILELYFRVTDPEEIRKSIAETKQSGMN